MNNITKGNWTINKHANTCVEVGNRSICSTGGYQSNVDSVRIYEENEANAKMIAIAGNLAQKYNLEAIEDLLAACEKAKSIFTQLADAGRYPEPCMAENGGEGFGFLTKAIEKARATGDATETNTNSDTLYGLHSPKDELMYIHRTREGANKHQEEFEKAHGFGFYVDPVIILD